MKTIFLLAWIIFSANAMFGQSENDLINIRQFEDRDDEDQSASDEDEYLLQWMEMLARDPLNINDPKIGVAELSFLPPHLAANLIAYRGAMGLFLSIYELQAVPGFTVDIIKQVLPFIVVKDITTSSEKFLRRFTGGNHSLVSRPTFPSKVYNRYKYQYNHLLQWGILTEKDQGEASLIDFYSMHLYTADIGIIKSLVIGDYVINMGQGLIHWQSQAFKKTSSVLNIKRQSPVIRPYHSAGEYNFQRGAAVTLQRGAWEATIFASFRRLSGSLAFNEQGDRIISSINTSGLHRTATERNNKNNILLQSYGIACKNIFPKGHIGINSAMYIYSLPLQRRNDPYNIYAVAGKQWNAVSADYSFTHNNLHIFGEVAFANEKAGMLKGIIASLHSTIDIAMLYRKMPKGFQSVYGNAFTENTLPVNEEGQYLGVAIRPHRYWKLDFYIDCFRFPWLKYRVHAPTMGYQYFTQVTWKPDKRVELYGQLRIKSKALNESGHVFAYPQYYIQKNLRTHLSFQATPALQFRSRLEVCYLARGINTDPETGFLVYGEIHIKLPGSPASGNFRIQVFESDSYDTRIYAYEQDVLYTSSIPFFYRKGMRLYGNFKWKYSPSVIHKILININLKVSASFFSPTLSSSSQAVVESRLQCIFQHT